MVKANKKNSEINIVMEWLEIPTNQTPTEVLDEWKNLDKLSKKKVKVI
ncbi:MAG TPA: hypothetical protein VIO58_05960 [Candidatus Methanoperedens sp.]